ncbi:MAG: hypothetical protein UU82_C0003G0010 [Candidatus Nomurabacteria bacterium GW2011_GWC2_41_8]|uniref:Uncharacterized protein n=3 Tax=Candidatus Nomuraibacteriota TaxID=1752729 RepID=A0A1F6YDI0_9BACT|nr:MAG: hypothetical protein UU58_C0001G0057 [Candidatus Nomurabacteria bacterium GW2011_GWA2_41_25]KKS24578.1 MAG: hypothetical protein UU82_C0003G0010 [Candidatus Nomurabacteria bacterium GW2011_GWC2_41_8]OGI66987.1 MAG: hypothetical protein A2823_02725 [Candidatus Nomurabacteria bacterium RIFCSPHIGHO2_01_FULL_41_91]OGI80466.1 MAG: hypothetical protein A3D43_00340 [Candidatus Nomurabacteria bacterium RIFCSPHIGHO2_02_FULL_41_52]OGI85132.1 MAG: hypothetical protein A3F49_01745 [Candidatus Nomur
MSDENVRLKIGEHDINATNHPHAYAALAGMSDELRDQLFKHVENHQSGVFSAHVNGKTVEYKLGHDGSIHPHH